MLLMIVERPKLVSLGGHGPDVLVVVHLTKDDSQLLGKPLHEEKQEEGAVLMAGGTQLSHLMQQLRRLPPAQRIQLV
jgi:hypothetical protein